MTALQAAGFPDVEWKCGGISQPAKVPPTSCYAAGLVGERRILIIVDAHLDTFTGVDLSLRADVTPWY